MKFVSDDSKDKLTKPLKELPHPSKKSVELASVLAKLGLDDADSAKANYKAGRFANAAKDLQQAVEKGAKAFGLLVGTVEPTEEQLKFREGVSHLAYRAFILNFWNFYPKLLSMMDLMHDATQMKEADNFVTRGIVKKLADATDALRKLRPPQSQIDAEIKELLDLDEESMWKATLDLDMKNKWVSDAVKGMKQNPIVSNNLQTSISFAGGLMKRLGVFSDEDMQQMKFAGNLGKASQKLFSLSLLTTWHHETARYPPIGKRDYWDPTVYKRGIRYVDGMPNLIKASKDALEGAIEACRFVQP